MNKLRPLVIIGVSIAALLYLGGLLWAGIESIKSPNKPEIPEILTHALTVIGGVLATHFGAIFGISQLNGKGRRTTPGLLSVHLWAALPQAAGRVQGPALSWLQVTAAYFYFLSLVGALVFWLLDGFSTQTADAVQNMSFTLAGVSGGMLAVALNVRPSSGAA